MQHEPIRLQWIRRVLTKWAWRLYRWSQRGVRKAPPPPATESFASSDLGECQYLADLLASLQDQLDAAQADLQTQQNIVNGLIGQIAATSVSLQLCLEQSNP